MLNNKLLDNPKLAKTVLESQERLHAAKIEMGFLGKIIGGTSSAPFSICFIVIVASTLGLIFLPLCTDKIPYKLASEIFVPIISLFSGYLFGKGSKTIQ